MTHLQSLSWLEINSAALVHNFRVLKNMAPHAKMACVIKSNAYGHGMLQVESILRQHTDWYAVNTMEELASIRTVNQKTPVLVMGLNGIGVDKMIKQFHKWEPFSLVLSAEQSKKELLRQYPELNYHIKIDTGLSRLGYSAAEYRRLLGELKKEGGFRGLMTHFANVEDVSDQNYACAQLNQFLELKDLGTNQNPDFICHSAASAAMMLIPESRLDMVRPGIALYGFWPSSQTRLSLLSLNPDLPELKPVLSWKARIVHTHQIRAGASVGYGCTHRVERDTKIAIVPVGYYEGYDRQLSNQSYVLIGGQRAPLLGRISMNMMIVDVSLIEGVLPGDEVCLIGNQQNTRTGQRESISADQLAEWAGTIHYEIVTRILPQMERRIV